MPISYALFLGIPIGVFFYFIGKVILRTMFGHFESQERRSSLVFSAFGLLLVPTIWTTGVIQEEFPDRGGSGNLLRSASDRRAHHGETRQTLLRRERLLRFYENRPLRS